MHQNYASSIAATSGVNTATGGALATGGASASATTAPATYGISGTVAGLLGSGLSLSLNAGSPLAIAGNGPFAFPTKLVAGSGVVVTVAAQPTDPQQICTVSAAGTLASLVSNLTNVVITCVTYSYSVGGTITGLTGSGLTLQNNNGADLVVTAGSTSFVFPTAVPNGQVYAVSIKTQPTLPTQLCSISSETGPSSTSAVTDVAISCITSSFKIGGTVSGLQGSGLVLQNNGGDDEKIEVDGKFVFNQPILSGAAFAVAVKTQPTSTPPQTCTVTGGEGTVTSAEVSNVVINCSTTKYAIGGTVSGLAGTGLTLSNNGVDDLEVTGQTFQFATGVEFGGNYLVTIAQQPTNPTQKCTVINGTGGPLDANVTTVEIACVTKSYYVGGNVEGLTGTGLVLTNNGTDDKTIDAVGHFSFTTSALSGTTYWVKVKTQPTTGACSVAAGYGNIGSSDVSSVAVSCSDQVHSVSGTVSGLLGSGLKLSLNGNAPQDVAGDGSVVFTDPVANGSAYAVTVSQQPTIPSQTCVVTNDSGTTGTADINNVAVNCTTHSHALSGTITGLKGSGLVLKQKSTEELLPVTASGTGTDSFSFATPVLSGQSTDVTVDTQPTSPTQKCEVTSDSGGIIVDAAVTSVRVTCTTTPFKVTASVTGLVGTLVITNNTNDPLTFTADRSLDFTNRVDSGQNYSVAVTTPPTNQTCVVTGGTANGAGTITDADVTVTVTCTTNAHYVSGTFTGYLGTGVTLKNSGGDDLVINPSTGKAFQFATKLAPGVTYDVTVATAPTYPTSTTDPLTRITCGVLNGKGTMGSADVTNVIVSCPGYTFDSTSQGWGAFASSGTNPTVTWNGTAGQPDMGALQVQLGYTGSCANYVHPAIIPALNVDMTGLTKMTALIRVVDHLPTTDKAGNAKLFIQNGTGSYPIAYSADVLNWSTAIPDTWTTLTMALPATGVDITSVWAFGIDLWFGTASTCQPTTILIDSVTFE